MKLTPEQLDRQDRIIKAFVSLSLLDAQNPIKTNGKGPTHAPIIVYEDTPSLDDEILEVKDATGKYKSI